VNPDPTGEEQPVEQHGIQLSGPVQIVDLIKTSTQFNEFQPQGR